MTNPAPEGPDSSGMTNPTQPGQTRAAEESALGWPLLVLCALQLMVVLDGTVVNLALARIQQDLQLTDVLRSWVITSYALAYGGLLLLGGRIGDVFGRRRVFLAGVGLFTVASLICGVSMNPTMLVAARIVQGLGAAIASPAAMALIVVTFAPGKPRNQAFSVFAMMTGLGSVAGLVIGGALTAASWRWIFLINVPIGVLILIAGVLTLTVVPETEGVHLDVRGAVLATAASTLLVFGLSAGGGGVTPALIVTVVLGLILLVAFVLSQRSATDPVLPLGLFTNRSRAAVFVCLVLVGGLMMAMTVQVALFVQEVLGFSPLQAGVAFIPFAIALGAGSAVAGKLAERLAPRWIVALGCVILTAGFVYSATLTPAATYWPSLLVPILAIGAGIGIVLIPLTLSVVAGVRPDEVGPLTATSLVSQTLGGPLGLAAVTAVAESISRARLGDGVFDGLDHANLTVVEQAGLGAGYTQSLLLCAGLAVAVLVVALVWVSFTPEDIAEGKRAEQEAGL